MRNNFVTFIQNIHHKTTKHKHVGLTYTDDIDINTD